MLSGGGNGGDGLGEIGTRKPPGIHRDPSEVRKVEVYAAVNHFFEIVRLQTISTPGHGILLPEGERIPGY